MQLHYKGQCWCDCSVDEVLMRCHGKDEYWHGFSANKMLTWFHGEEECWRSLGVNEVLLWLYVEKASLEKTKCKYCFSSQSNGDVSMQMQELVQLHDKNNWHGCTAKTSVEHLHAKTSASIALLQQSVVVLLNYQDKG